MTAPTTTSGQQHSLVKLEWDFTGTRTSVFLASSEKQVPLSVHCNSLLPLILREGHNKFTSMFSSRRPWLQVTLVSLLHRLASGNDINGATGAVNSTTPSTVENEITVHTIMVGQKEHYFTPNSVNALPGDIISFKFWPGNHSVIRAEFGYPCIPYEDLEIDDVEGFYSGVYSPDSIDVTRDTVCADAYLDSWEKLNDFVAPFVESDHQHDLSRVLLLRCTW
jgi:plastocyanin